MFETEVNMAKKKTRDKILDTTLGIVGKEGPGKITVRRISTQAKVNVAAINYYFGSKEQLIEEVFKKLGDKLDEQFEILYAEGIECNQRLRDFALNILEFMILYPGLVNYLFFSSITKGSVRHVVFQNEPKRQERVNMLLSKCTGTTDPVKLSMKTNILFSAMMHPIVSLQNKVNADVSKSFQDPEYRKGYISLLVDGILKSAQ